jgi:aerobic-type carbon monoxide dehydrogenase small subunit (CoxS/CutS family)
MNDSNTEGFGAQSRRTFFKSVGTAAVTAATASAKSVAAELEKANTEKIIGPGAIPVALKVNGQLLNLQLEPRVTLLDALRNYSSLTGAKEGCDRASCGACTVLLDGKPIYGCQKLAIEAQGHDITTVEGLEQSGELSAIQRAFIDKDALMCGYCTPGFLMSLTGLFSKNPHPTADEIRHACAGNLCRCGTQPHIMQAALQVAGSPVAGKTEVIHV